MPKSKHPPLRKVLAAIGATDLPPIQFHTFVWQCFEAKFPLMADEELLYTPVQAVAFGAYVRNRLRERGYRDVKTLTDFYILRSLVASRKLGLRTPKAVAS